MDELAEQMKGNAAVADDLTDRLESKDLHELMEKARAGSRAAFDQMIQSVEQDVMRTALYLTRNLHDAQDVAQEVYIKLFRHVHRSEGVGNLRGWIYRITLNTARDLLRKRRLWVPFERLMGSISAGISTSERVRQSEIQSRLLRAFELLTFKERAAFILKDIHELDTTEVAEIMGCRPVTVRGHLHTARRKLQKIFRDFQEDR